MNLNDQLAFQRTHWALERTQLAWIRTTFALTTASVAIEKGAAALHQYRAIPSPLIGTWGYAIGTVLAIYTTLQWIVSTVQYVRRDRELRTLAGTPASNLPSILPLSVMAILLSLGIPLLVTFFW
jgi:uncharacterized membrane protein YidH (DUF202 family)